VVADPSSCKCKSCKEFDEFCQFTSGISRRVQRLEDHARRLRSGLTLEPLGAGADEIAHLDEALSRDASEIYLRRPDWNEGKWLSATARPLRDGSGISAHATPGPVDRLKTAGAKDQRISRWTWANSWPFSTIACAKMPFGRLIYF